MGQVATELHRWALPNDADAGLEDAVRELRPQNAKIKSLDEGNGMPNHLQSIAS